MRSPNRALRCQGSFYGIRLGCELRPDVEQFTAGLSFDGSIAPTINIPGATDRAGWCNQRRSP